MAAKAYLSHMKSPANVPNGCSSIQFEICYNNRSSCDRDFAINNCKYALKKMSLAAEEDIIVTDYRILEFGNVIFKHGIEESAKQVIGRFGKWEYLWSDQAFLSGYDLTS